MVENITKSLKGRQLNIGFNPENFVSVNYFNESMMTRMRIEHRVSHGLESWDQHVQCTSWNSSGLLFACGKCDRGVQMFEPFRNAEASSIPVPEGHYLTDALFLHRHDNLIAVCSRSNRSFFWDSPNGLGAGSRVGIWDVRTKTEVRSHGFRGFVKQVAASKALPNHIWFNIDRKTKRIAEADIRSPSYRRVELNDAENNTYLFQSESFDVNPVDEVTIVVSDGNKINFYDRRTMSSSRVNHPYKTVDTSSLSSGRSYILKLKYDPSGKKLFVTSSRSFKIFQHVAPAKNPDVESLREFRFRDQTMVATVTKYPSFLGEKHVLFDTYFRNYSVVFNHENMRYVGKINQSGQSDYFSDVSSLPHPLYCLIASTNQGTINFITPTFAETDEMY